MKHKTTREKRKAQEKKHHVIVKRSSAGLGLYTTAPRKKDDHIVEYTGDRISEDEANERGGKYLFTVEKNLVIDGRDHKHLARYINHACKPNCYAEIDVDERKVHIRAKRALTEGEELTYHYGREYFNDHIKPYGCRCAGCAAGR